MKPYKVPFQAAEAEFIERKSRFISNISPVASSDEALSFLADIRAKYPDANHNVYAYHIKDGGLCRFNDDGEPSGTAGKPLLEVFTKQQVFDYCSVATRYFGGIPLGAGGLIRAYARCGVIALEAATIGYMCEMALCKLKLPYPLYEQGKRLMSHFDIGDLNEDFGVDVEIKFSISSVILPQLQAEFTELTHGAVSITEEGAKLGKKRTPD